MSELEEWMAANEADRMAKREEFDRLRARDQAWQRMANELCRGRVISPDVEAKPKDLADLGQLMELRRQRARRAIATLREACTLRPDCAYVDDAADDAAARILVLERDMERVMDWRPPLLAIQRATGVGYDRARTLSDVIVNHLRAGRRTP